MMLQIPEDLSFRELVWGLIAYKPDTKFFSKEELERRIKNSSIPDFSKLASEVKHGVYDGIPTRLDTALDFLVISGSLKENPDPLTYRMNTSSKATIADLLNENISQDTLKRLKEYAKEFWGQNGKPKDQQTDCPHYMSNHGPVYRAQGHETEDTF